MRSATAGVANFSLATMMFSNTRIHFTVSWRMEGRYTSVSTLRHHHRTSNTMTNTDYFRKLSLEDTFSRLVHIFAQRWAVFLTVTVLAYILIAVVTSVTMMFLIPALASSSIYDENGTMNLTLFYSHLALISLLETGIYYAFMCVADGAIIRAVAEIYVNQVPTVFDTLQQGVYKFGPLLCTAALLGIVIGVPAFSTIALITVVAQSSDAMYASVMCAALIFGCIIVWIMVVTYHVYPSIVVENLGTINSIKRSWELSKGHRCYIFSTVLIFASIKFLLSSLCKAIGQTGGNGTYMLAQILFLVVNIFFGSFQSILQAIVYISVRTDKENLNLGILSTELFGSEVGPDGVSYVFASESEMTGKEATAATASEDNHKTLV